MSFNENNLFHEVIHAINGAVNNYIDDSDISKLKKILDEKLLNDPDYNKDDFVNDFDNICSNAGIYFDEFFIDELDEAVMYYDDCLNFIKNNRYYNGWEEIANTENGGEPFENISHLVYCMLLKDFYENGGEELLAEKVYDLITS